MGEIGMGEIGEVGGGGRKEHPLKVKNLSSITTWVEWKQLWEKAETWQELVGLLHFGFDVSTYNRNGADFFAERVIFYLDLADGFHAWTNKGDEPTKEIGEKAWNVFCDKFVRPALRDDREKHWLRYVFEDERLFDRILDFFTGENGHYNTPSPRSDDFRDKEVVGFLMKLFDNVWRKFDDDNCWGMEENRDGVADISKRLFASRPKFILLLSRLEKLDVLLDHQRYSVDEASMAELKTLALQRSYDEDFQTVEAAVHGGSDEAHIYLLLKVKQKEEFRLHEIREAEAAREEAERKLAKLAAKR